jgi:hypothetical protein
VNEKVYVLWVNRLCETEQSVLQACVLLQIFALKMLQHRLIKQPIAHYNMSLRLLPCTGSSSKPYDMPPVPQVTI